MSKKAKTTNTRLPDVLLFEPVLHTDERGLLFESWNSKHFVNATGCSLPFVQDVHAYSRQGVIRGIHYQLGMPQGKLLRVLRGEILDIAIDLRRQSAYFGQWVATELTAQNRRQVWIPPGFGHAYLVRSDVAEVLYKTTAFWSPNDERCIHWADPTLAIDWSLQGLTPQLSSKDQAGIAFIEADVFD